MNKSIFLSFFIPLYFAFTSIKAQTDVINSDSIFINATKAPEFIGNYINFLQKNLKYPTEDIKKGTQGKVILEFVVDTNGTITAPLIKQSISPSLDQEALRIAGLTNGNWSPAVFEGKKVRFRKSIAINFVLQKDE
jgi:TonB family protein